MAKGNAKASLAKNKKRMALFKKITVGVNAAAILYLFGVSGTLFTFGSIVCLVFFAGQEYICLTQIEKHGKPHYGDSGQIASINDLSNPKEMGMFEYVQDLLWVCWCVQLLLLVTSWAWLIYLLVPCYVVYKTWDTLQPLAKKAMESRQTGQNPFVPNIPGTSRPLPGSGQSRKEKRAAARQHEKDEKNAEKAAKKIVTRQQTKENARPFPPR
ncbi:hypothetical protein DIPPA_08506 [Diplonema papillatum]|nr:hypothetical protein DIPPA_08506 [Diplonema papillatum]